MDGGDGPILVNMNPMEAHVVEPLVRGLRRGRESMVKDPKRPPPKPLRGPGHAWVELRGWPVKGSLEIKEYPDATPATCEATIKVEVATGQIVTVVRRQSDGDRQELERQCQEIFDAGDVVLSGPLLLMEDETLVVATRWEPVKE